MSESQDHAILSSTTEAPERQRLVVVRALGGFEFVIGGQQIQRWRAGRARNLLQYMLLRPGRLVTREALHDSLWPEQQVSPSSLKVAIHTLRGIFAAHLPTAHGGGSTADIELVTLDNGYMLRAENVWMDFRAVDSLIDDAQAAEAHGDHAAARAMYEAALELYEGDFLPDVDMDWATAHREWLRSRILMTLERLVDVDMHAGRYLAATGWCRQILDIEPYQEETYRRLMVMHGRLGHVEQVRRWFRLCHSRLQAGLQATPEPATRTTFQEAVRGDLIATLPSASSESDGAPGTASGADHDRRSRSGGVYVRRITRELPTR